jgi:methyl-accepting chemotaxis protein
MELDAVWLAITKIYAVVMIIVTLALTVGIIFIGVKLSRLIDRALRLLGLVTDKAEETAETVSRTTGKIVQQAERTAAAAEENIERATANLEEASAAVKRAALGKAGEVAALVVGVVKGLGGAHTADRPRPGGETDD